MSLIVGTMLPESVSIVQTKISYVIWGAKHMYKLQRVTALHGNTGSSQGYITQQRAAALQVCTEYINKRVSYQIAVAAHSNTTVSLDV